MQNKPKIIPSIGHKCLLGTEVQVVRRMSWVRGWFGGRWAGQGEAGGRAQLEGAPLKWRARRAPQPSRWPKLGQLSSIISLIILIVTRSENGECGGSQVHLQVSNGDSLRPIIANGGSQVLQLLTMSMTKWKLGQLLFLPPTYWPILKCSKPRWRTWCQLCLKYHAEFFRRWIPTNLNLSSLMHPASGKQQLVKDKKYSWTPEYKEILLIAFSQYLNISIPAKLGKFCSIFRQVWVDISFLFPAASHHPPWFFDQPNPWRGPFSRYLFIPWLSWVSFLINHSNEEEKIH